MNNSALFMPVRFLMSSITDVLSNNKVNTINTEIADLNKLRESVADRIAGNDYAILMLITYSKTKRKTEILKHLFQHSTMLTGT